MCCIVNTVLAFPPPDNIWQTDILPFTSSQIFFWPISISTIPINIIHENFTMTLSCKLWFCLINVFFLSLHFRCLFVWLSLYCLRWQSQYLPLQTAEVEEGWRLEEEARDLKRSMSFKCTMSKCHYPAGQWASFLKESTPWHSIPDVLMLPLLFIHNPIFVNWAIVIPMTKFT